MYSGLNTYSYSAVTTGPRIWIFPLIGFLLDTLQNRCDGSVVESVSNVTFLFNEYVFKLAEEDSVDSSRIELLTKRHARTVEISSTFFFPQLELQIFVIYGHAPAEGKPTCM